MQYAMQVFEDAEHDQFRVIDRHGEPWFVLNEVCRKLGMANPRDAAARLDADEKDVPPWEWPLSALDARYRMAGISFDDNEWPSQVIGRILTLSR